MTTRGSDQTERNLNTTPFETRFSLIKFTMAAYMAPVAVQVTALHNETIWVLAAVGLCILVLVSARFRFMWSNVPLFRHTIAWTAAVQAIALTLSRLMSVNWPMIAGLVVAFTLAVLCVIHGMNVVARHYSIPE